MLIETTRKAFNIALNIKRTHKKKTIWEELNLELQNLNDEQSRCEIKNTKNQLVRIAERCAKENFPIDKYRLYNMELGIFQFWNNKDDTCISFIVTKDKNNNKDVAIPVRHYNTNKEYNACKQTLYKLKATNDNM